MIRSAAKATNALVDVGDGRGVTIRINRLHPSSGRPYHLNLCVFEGLVSEFDVRSVLVMSQRM